MTEARQLIRHGLKEFIPLATVDPVYFENTHYLGADKGGEKPSLLANAMAKSGHVAIAELVSRDKEQLVLIRTPQGTRAALRCIMRTRSGIQASSERGDVIRVGK